MPPDSIYCIVQAVRRTLFACSATHSQVETFGQVLQREGPFIGGLVNITVTYGITQANNHRAIPDRWMSVIVAKILI